ncbi:MAG: Nramp family divalent metal transporter [Candidatus Handelsmanbacteria bacterium]|nr:Nramp family divalent metal transporter [Candidatus Handelsmanbacteria bacterium]
MADTSPADPRPIHKVPDPLPLTLAGLVAAVGPQAINFGISIGGGEAYFLPNIAGRGAFGFHWLILISLVLETTLVYQCIKYSCCTGRSFFAGTSELYPRRFWPWFWAMAAILTFGWPAWMAGAVVAAAKFTGLTTQTLFPGSTLPPQYLWSVIALVMVLVVFYFSNRTYAFLAKFFEIIMVTNILLVLLITLLVARPTDYLAVLEAYLGVHFFTQGTAGLSALDLTAMYNQPGGSLMWVSFWVVAAGWGMGRYAGQVTGALKPPEQITAGELRWDTADPGEVAKMKQWVRVGGWSLIIWWALIGGLLMTYLYSVAGYAYLHDEYLRSGAIPKGVQIPLQMATIAQGVLGQTAGWLMLLAVMVTLYDAQFPFYDTFIGRTTTDAIAVTARGGPRRSYRFYYFLVVTLAVIAGLYLVLLEEPLIIWMLVATAAVAFRSIGSLQIMLINKRRLPPEFQMSRLSQGLLWFSFFTGLGAVAYWAATELPKRLAGG